MHIFDRETNSPSDSNRLEQKGKPLEQTNFSGVWSNKIGWLYRGDKANIGPPRNCSSNHMFQRLLYDGCLHPMVQSKPPYGGLIVVNVFLIDGS